MEVEACDGSGSVRWKSAMEVEAHDGSGSVRWKSAMEVDRKSAMEMRRQ